MMGTRRCWFCGWKPESGNWSCSRPSNRRCRCLRSKPAAKKLGDIVALDNLSAPVGELFQSTFRQLEPDPSPSPWVKKGDVFFRIHRPVSLRPAARALERRQHHLPSGEKPAGERCHRRLQPACWKIGRFPFAFPPDFLHQLDTRFWLAMKEVISLRLSPKSFVPFWSDSECPPGKPWSSYRIDFLCGGNRLANLRWRF